MGRQQRYCSKPCGGKARRLLQEEPEPVEVREPEPPLELGPSEMWCPHLLCGKKMHLDAGFFRQAVLYNSPTRRWYCASGHTKYDPAPLELRDRARCGTHPNHALPCTACMEQSVTKRRLAGVNGGRANRGKHSGSIWATSA